MRQAVAIAAVAAALAGCASLQAPAQPHRPAPPPRRPAPPPAISPVARAQRTHEYPGTKPAPQSAAGSASAVDAVTAFASAYINWDARTVASDMQVLAQQSIGQARSEMELAAAQTASDYELRRGGIANAGVVETVAALPGSPGRYVVVTRERTTATATDAYQGLRPAWHVALATVVRVGAGRWAVSGWQPET